jgi:uncharacterized protein YegP (UPF0339 family)
MYFDIYKNQKGQYWWVAKGGNNETLCASEMLTTKQACKRTIKAIMEGAPTATVYDETGETAGDMYARRVSV